MRYTALSHLFEQTDGSLGGWGGGEVVIYLVLILYNV